MTTGRALFERYHADALKASQIPGAYVEVNR